MFAIAMIVVVPVGVMFAGAAWSLLFGWLSSEESVEAAAEAGDTK